MSDPTIPDPCPTLELIAACEQRACANVIPKWEYDHMPAIIRELRRLVEVEKAAQLAVDFIWALCGPNLSQYKGAWESHDALKSALAHREGQ